jgi:hypothetical protein
MLLAACGIPSSVVAKTFSATETRIAVGKFAACVVRKRTAVARELVLKDDNGPQLHKILDGGCIPPVEAQRTQMVFPAGNAILALAEALVRKDFADAKFDDFSSVPALKYSLDDHLIGTPVDGEQAENRKTRMSIAFFLRVFGECVVRHDPQNAQMLLLSSWDSVEEKEATTRLGDAMSVCLPAEQTIKLTKDNLRGGLALNYYRLAYAMRNAAALKLAPSEESHA